MKKQVLIGLLIAVALLGLVGVVAALGHHKAPGDSRHVAEMMDCIPAVNCG